MRVFIDSNVIIDLLRGKDKVLNFFELIDSEEIVGFTNKIVFLETIHVYLILKTGKGPKELRKNRGVIKEVSLSPILEVFEIMEILPIDSISNEEISRVVNIYGLLPNDALIAATCKHYGIKKIATFDEDFKRVDFLEVLEL